ncbi:hypothetical protein S40285_07252 [Stachybotrys chlorohalonatus IBT 40285]|uniref:SET domain-containing protein n=1 Tax=Stachybotrys chlorohalonatus (strain IBT 40285) TaxID=1283841 RepID=A0A084QGD6_STAC4|nr:hypothetical protein S40285_07252 [Stachybotrys chlorohalonata IBT 40285]
MNFLHGDSDESALAEQLQASLPRVNGLFSRNEPASNIKPPKASLLNLSRVPISPPPLKRSSTSATPAGNISPTLSTAGSLSGADFFAGSAPEMAKTPSLNINVGTAATSQTSLTGTPSSHHSQTRKATTPKGQSQFASDPRFHEIVSRIQSFYQDVKESQAQLAACVIDDTRTSDRRVSSGPDLFADVKVETSLEKKGQTVRVKFKQHIKNRREGREEHHVPKCIKTNKDRVPSYRFHHVEIKKNILTPNTMLTFVPHLRDLESSEEVKYNLWLKELEDYDLQSGFKPMSREEKELLTIQSERAATLSLYLESWLDRLAIPGCSKSNLIRYMAKQESDNAITPQQKTSLLRSHREDPDVALGADRAAQIFTDAFRQVFKENQTGSMCLELRNVLQLEESVDSIMDTKPTAKDGSSQHHDNEYDVAEFNLATYSILGCLICFSHACEHGEYDALNCKRTFSLLSGRSRLSDALRRRQPPQVNGIDPSVQPAGLGGPCQRRCYLRSTSPNRANARTTKPWTEGERTVLRSIVVTADNSKVQTDPICLVAEFLDRDCNDVNRELRELNVNIPASEVVGAPRVKNLPWYDRHRKVLSGDWQEQTLSHEFEQREIPEPCNHEGPCAPRVCPCVDAGLLCERFCRCTVESCAYKFTGCACHSQGRTCMPKQKDKPCICVQLNRECDPELCGSCGARERTDPVNSQDDWLHSFGCQNCDLQRGARKSLLLGQSQLEGVGYGLFTAEDIAQDEFIVEYVGELITHDEGVRREARRGDVFDEESTVSYLFTLLENEGIWVDAAVYGNLSRYINHATENEKRGCNISPRILYVNGEYRIKFTAMRDIKAGEELFFNYGKEFPNLTKKLLDDKAGAKSEPAKRKGRKPKAAVAEKKAPRGQAGKPGPKRGRKPKREIVEVVDDEVMLDVWEGAEITKSRKRKRNLQDDSEEEEYHPTGTEGGASLAPSESDSDTPLTGSVRLRKRSKQVRRQTVDSPLKRVAEPKTRGKRGGARPGSGRPRKHPRPVPKPIADAATATLASVSVATRTAIGPAPGTDTLALAETASDPSNTAQVSNKIDLDADSSGTVRVESLASASITIPLEQSTGHKEVRPAKDVMVPEIDDSQDGTPQGEAAEDHEEEEEEEDLYGNEDDDEDQDVIVRKRQDRASRNRRKPAKFRDENPWV